MWYVYSSSCRVGDVTACRCGKRLVHPLTDSHVHIVHRAHADAWLQLPDMETGFALREDLYDALGISAPTRPVARVLLYLRQSPTGYGPRHILNLEEVLDAVRSTGVPFTYVGLYYGRCSPWSPALPLTPEVAESC